jgi:hypothetical protein
MDIQAAVTSLNLLAAKTIDRERIDYPAGDPTVLPDGTVVITNENAQIVYASFISGTTVARHQDYVVCSNIFGERWFCNQLQFWSRLD